MSLYRTAVNRPVTTALVFMAFAILGVFSLMNTSISLYPDFDANAVMVASTYPGANSSDVETNLTKLLENALNGVPNLKNLTTQSKEAVSLVGLEFEYGTDIDVAVNDIRDKLSPLGPRLPEGASVPVIFKFSADDMPVVILSASAEESLPSLEKILDERVVSPLARIKGVGTVSIAAAPKREIQILCDPMKLEAYGLTVSTLSQIIAAENRNIPSGSIDIGSDTYALRIQNEIEDSRELLDLVVASSRGQAVYLRDVARIVDGEAEEQQEGYTSGRRAATVVIQKQSGANTVNLVGQVRKKLAAIEKTLPSDVTLTTVVDSSTNIVHSIHSLRDTILITLLVVMLVVYVFLGRWRATFIIVLSIPIALLASLMYLYLTGNTLNVISMSALSIAIGMVVDDAIVVLENVSTHIERGERPKEAAVHATSEVGISVIASTLTMLCVFLSLTMVKGMAGLVFKQLGWIVSIIMTVSTVAALTLVPMLCSRMLTRTEKKRGRLGRAVFGAIDGGLNRISEGYARLIGWATSHRMLVVLLSAAIFCVTLGVLGPGVRTEFFPHNDQGRLRVYIELPVSTSQRVTREFAASLYSRISKDVPEIQICNYSFGNPSAENTFANINDNGDYIVNMNINIGSSVDRERSIGTIADIIRRDIERYPEVTKYKVSEGGGGMGGAPTVAVEIYGYNFDVTDAIAKHFREKMLATEEFTQVTLSRNEYTPEYQVRFDRTKLALNGLNSTAAALALSSAIGGAVHSQYREDGDEYKIRVRFAPEFRKSLRDIENIVVYTPAGKPVKMKELGEVVESRVPPTIDRKNRERFITVSGVVAEGHALSEAVSTAKAVIGATEIPSDISVEIAGDYEEQQKMFKDLFILMALIVILVYMVMASQFESFLSPFVIMFSIPFAVVGVILGLWVTDTPLGVMGMIGLIILLGIVVKNGIVLIDYTILMRERGMGVVEASVTAARSRLRPILMTTLTTVLGMVPMALGVGEGSEMWRSLGMTVSWGLSISTVVTLILIPTIYCSLSIRQERKAEKKRRKALKAAA